MKFSVSESLGRHNFKPAIIAALTVVLAVSLFVNSQLCYAISVNGETVGTAKDRAQAEELLSGAEEYASEILGYEYSLEDKVRVSAWLGGTDEGDVQTSDILGRLDELVRMNILYINGTAVAAAENAADIDGVLNSLLDGYRNEKTASASFVQPVTVRYAFADKSVLQDMTELKRLLSPDNETSDFSLDVKTTEYEQLVRDIPYETESYEDARLYEGRTAVTTPGELGAETVTVVNTFINGQLVGTEELSAEVTKEPVTEKVAIGTAPRPASASSGEYAWPCTGYITSVFGYRSVRIGSSNHKGLDIAADYGTEVYAADGGTVSFSGEMSGYGNIIIITHDNGDQTYYGHCSVLLAQQDERVSQGELIAYMGNSGVASGPHLHFEVRPGGGEPDDPLNYLPDDGSHQFLD